MDGEGGVVGLDDGVGDLWRGDDGEGGHHAVWELLTDLADQERTHASTSSTTEGVGDLEALEAVAALSLATDNIEDLVDKLSTLGVVTLCPVVASTRLTEDEVVGAEELTEWTGTNSIHSTWLQIDEDGTRNVLIARGLWHVSDCIRIEIECIYLIEINVHALELEVGCTIVPIEILADVKAMIDIGSNLHAGAIKTMLSRDGLPISRSVLIPCRVSRLEWKAYQKAAPICRCQ